MEEKNTGQERRHHKRYPFRYLKDYSIRFRRAGLGEFQISQGGNISYGGVLMLSPLSFTDNAALDVEISYVDDDGTSVKVVLDGSVRWVDKTVVEQTGDPAYYVGVQFIDMSKEKSSFLKKFIGTYILGTDIT